MIMEVACRMLERVGGILSLWRFLGESKGGEEGKRYLGKHFLSSRPSFSANQQRKVAPTPPLTHSLIKSL
ncbi:hypothetical protein I7I48_02248 [Histoplasma ohiense]|nr:hypothetical protein I7I48_02248 [Histoplasma ohiense (nom. inval.)]